jgi:GNAT superfamily N-acetyltransferase
VNECARQRWNVSQIWVARAEDIEVMREIERGAGSLFASIGMDAVAADEPPSSAVLSAYIAAQRAWIVEVMGRRAGYAIADIVDGSGHLEQVSVHPDFGRRGLGRALIGTVVAWAEGRGLPAVTLSTFRDVPWNAPYYAALGFRPLEDARLTAGLAKLRAHEIEVGLDVDARCFMRLELRDVR